MKIAMLGFLAETPIHPGAGRGLGVVDLPVAREAATDYPVIVGSSLKGALRDKAETVDVDVKARFGKPDFAGDLMVSDGRLLLLPIRSLTTSFRWATCPHLIERYLRDLRRAGLDGQPEVPEMKERRFALAKGEQDLFLEERQFKVTGEPADGLTGSIKPLLLHEETRKRLGTQIAVLHDSDFAWFARYGLTIQARNNLADDGSKKSNNLWYEETLPPETVMYALVAARRAEASDALDKLFPANAPYLQVGGNETVGHGWFGVTVRRRGEGEAE